MLTRTQLLSLTQLAFFKISFPYSPKIPPCSSQEKDCLIRDQEGILCSRIPRKSPNIHSEVTGLDHMANTKQVTEPGV